LKKELIKGCGRGLRSALLGTRNKGKRGGEEEKNIRRKQMGTISGGFLTEFAKKKEKVQY